MYCSKCGKKLNDDAKFCDNCGCQVDNNQDYQKYKRETFFEGAVYKCSNCGENLNSFMSICPSCGHEIRSRKEVSQKLNDFRIEMAKTADIHNKKELITNYAVENTKEEILEFFILAYSQIKDVNNPCYDAWKSKVEQLLMKARLLIKDTDEYEYMSNLWKTFLKNEKKYIKKHGAKKERTVTKKNTNKGRIIILLIEIALVLAIFIIGLVHAIYGFGMGEKYDSDQYYLMGVCGILIIFSVVPIVILIVRQQNSRRRLL